MWSPRLLSQVFVPSKHLRVSYTVNILIFSSRLLCISIIAIIGGYRLGQEGTIQSCICFLKVSYLLPQFITEADMIQH